MVAHGWELPPPPPPPTEEDGTVFNERLVALQPRMRAYALCLLRRNGAKAMREVDDVLQGADRRAIEAREHAPPPDSEHFVFWLKGHTRNAARDRVNRFQSPERMGKGDLMQEPEDAGSQPALLKLEAQEAVQAILIAAMRLPTREGEAFLAYYRWGLSPSEIACRYGWTRTAAESLIQRGRERIRGLLKADGWFS